MTTQLQSHIPSQEPDDEQVVRLDIIDLAEPDEEYWPFFMATGPFTPPSATEWAARDKKVLYFTKNK
jgi:hypothetical protein